MRGQRSRDRPGILLARALIFTVLAVFATAIALWASSGTPQAQIGPPPNQSLQPTPSPCSAGSQSVRVCNDDFRSCSSVCTATALDPSADIAGCSLNCCIKFNACLRSRSCGARVVSCF